MIYVQFMLYKWITTLEDFRKSSHSQNIFKYVMIYFKDFPFLVNFDLNSNALQALLMF